MTRITISAVAAPWTSLLVSLLPGICLAQGDAADGDSIGPYDLSEIIVTASRRQESAFEMPYFVNSQDMVRLQHNRQVRTIPDAMREMPAVMVQKTAHGQGSPFIRGFTGLRTLFLIDGIRLNNSVFREGPNQYWNTVDPYSVGRLELVKGPSSVLYGSDAIGGTVNAISRSLSDYDSQGGLVGRFVLRGSTAEDSSVARPELGYSGDTVDVLFGASFKDFGDVKAGGSTGTQPKTGYDEVDADVKLNVDLGSGNSLTAAVQHVDQDDAWRTHRTIFGKNWKGTTNGSELQRILDQERTLAYLQYKATNVIADGSELVLSLSHHAQEESQDRIRSDGRRDVQGIEVGTLGLWGQISLPSRYGVWTIGAEVYDDDVDSFRTDYNADGSLRAVRIQGPVADDASYKTTSLFVQDQLTIGDKTDLIAGLRYTRADANARSVQDPVSGERIAIRDDWTDVTGSLRLSRQLGDGFRIFAGASQGFRAPNLSDLTRLSTARSNEIETPVIGLDPERFVTYELGFKFERERLDAQVSTFYTSIDDMIIRTPTGRVIDGDNEVTKLNSGKGDVEGVELQARYRISDSWQVFGNFTWMDGEIDTYPTSEPIVVRETIDRLMPMHLWLGGRWRPAGADYWLEGLASIAEGQYELSSRDARDTDRIPPGGTPGYTALTLRGGWQVSDSLSVSIALENLTDKNYRVHGSGLNEPGRNLIVSLIWGP